MKKIFKLQHIMDGIYCTRRLMYDMAYEYKAIIDENTLDRHNIIDNVIRKIENPKAELKAFSIIKNEAIYKKLYSYLKANKFQTYNYLADHGKFKIYYRGLVKQLNNNAIVPVFVHNSSKLTNDYINYKTMLVALRKTYGYILWCKVPAIKKRMKETDEQFANRLMINIEFEMIPLKVTPNELILITQNITDIYNDIENSNYRPSIGSCKTITSKCKYFHLCWSNKTPSTTTYKNPNKERDLFTEVKK